MLLIYATQGYDKQIILEDRTDASVVRRGDQINIPRVRTLVEEKDYENRDQTSKRSDKQYKYEEKMCGWLTLKSLICSNGGIGRRASLRN